MINSIMDTSYRFEKQAFPDSYFYYRRLQEKRIAMERDDVTAHDKRLPDIQGDFNRRDANLKIIAKIDQRLKASKINKKDEQRSYAPYAWKSNLVVRQAALRNMFRKEFKCYEEELNQIGLSFPREWKGLDC